MDLLLRNLEASGVGLSLKEYYAWGFLHADDIRTLATSEESLMKQVQLVKQFADRNLLKLNVNKCEIVPFFKSLFSSSVPKV